MTLIILGVLLIWDIFNRYVAMRSKSLKHKTDKIISYKKQVLVNAIRLIGLNLFGALFFMFDQDFTFWKALYFAVETTGTIGYGDVTFHPGLELFLVFYMLIAAALFAYALNYLNFLKNEETRREEEKEEGQFHDGTSS